MKWTFFGTLGPGEPETFLNLSRRNIVETHKQVLNSDVIIKNQITHKDNQLLFPLTTNTIIMVKTHDFLPY